MYHIVAIRTFFAHVGTGRIPRRSSPPEILFSSTDADDCRVYIRDLHPDYPLADPDLACQGVVPLLSTGNYTYWLVDGRRADFQGQVALLCKQEDPAYHWAECRG